MQQKVLIRVKPEYEGKIELDTLVFALVSKTGATVSCDECGTICASRYTKMFNPEEFLSLARNKIDNFDIYFTTEIVEQSAYPK